MTEEQTKFMVNRIYRMISNSPNGMSFGELINWASRCRLNDQTFLDLIDALEMSKLVTRQGERYSVYPLD
jgi:hypothetical protein